MFLHRRVRWEGEPGGGATMNDRSLETAAQQYEQAADERDRAAAHRRNSARHVRGREGARVGGHAFAAYGHFRRAQHLMDELTSIHAFVSQSLVTSTS